MELISKVSKGSKMDQVYIPKNRSGFEIGSHVVIKPLETEKENIPEKLYFYNVKSLEPLKLEIINEIIGIIDKVVKDYQNIIITGSFLDFGFNFNDIDVILVSEEKVNIKNIEKTMEDKIKIKAHIITFNNKALAKGLSTDPLYQVMLSKCVAKKRFVYRTEHKIDYKILDLHLLKSKPLVNNFDMLNGNEKYYLIRNMIAISLYLQGKKVNKEKVDSEVKKQFNFDIKEIKQNVLEKNNFLKKYKVIYNKTFNKLMKGVKDGAKQK